MKYIAGLMLMLAVSLAGCGSAEKGKAVQADKNPEKVVLIDVRSAGEFSAGHLQCSINIPHTEIAVKIAAAVPDKSATLRLYCRSGRRVKAAMEVLKKLNYDNLEDHGGMENAAENLSLPIVK